MPHDTALYDQLGVRHDASPDDIRRSYRQAALRWHPDRNPNDPAATEQFKACLEAYEVLSDPVRRAAYDTQRLTRRAAAQTAPTNAEPRSTSPFDQTPFASTFSASFGQTRMRAHPMSGFSGNWMPFSPSPFEQELPGNGTTFSTSASHSTFHTAAWSFFVNDTEHTMDGGEGTYAASFHTWNNVDGHRSGSSSGRLGDLRPGFANFGPIGASSAANGMGDRLPSFSRRGPRTSMFHDDLQFSSPEFDAFFGLPSRREAYLAEGWW